MRFKLIRQKLEITLTNLAEQLGTSQVMIYRIEKDEKIMSSLFLKLVLFFSPHVSLDALFAEQFNIEYERIFSKDYSVNTIVKERQAVLRDNWVTIGGLDNHSKGSKKTTSRTNHRYRLQEHLEIGSQKGNKISVPVIPRKKRWLSVSENMGQPPSCSG